MNDISGIYSIDCAANGKAYIGSAVNIRLRWNSHRHALKDGNHHSEKLQRSWDKYGEAQFAFNVLLICGKGDLISYEQRAIDEFDAIELGLNSNPVAGNSLGFKHRAESLIKIGLASRGRTGNIGHEVSAETRKKIGDANRGKKRTQQYREELSKRMIGNQRTLGFKHSQESKDKMSKAGKGRKRSPEAIEQTRQAVLGRKHSSETRAKISAARMGKACGPMPKETRRKISAALKGVARGPMTLETKAKIRETMTGTKRGPRSVEVRQKIAVGMAGNTNRADYLSDLRRKGHE